MEPELTYEDLNKRNKFLYDKVFVEVRNGYRKGSAEVTKLLLKNTYIKLMQFESQGVLMALRDAEKAVDLEKSLVPIITEKQSPSLEGEPSLLMIKEVAEFYGLIKPKRKTNYGEAVQDFNEFLKGTGIPEFTLTPSARDTSKYKNDGKVGLRQ